MKAYDAFKQEEDYLNATAAMLKMKNWEGLQERIEKLLEENASLKKQVAEAANRAMANEADSYLSAKQEINGIPTLFVSLKDHDPKGLKEFAETLRNKMNGGFVFVSNENEGKVTFVCASCKEAIAKGMKAGDLVKKAAQVCGGNGGGRPDMAQAGGKDPSHIAEAIEVVKQSIQG